MNEEGGNMERKTGILLALSSLPGNQGIGDLGLHAMRFIDAIAKHGIKVWQVLPFNAVGYGNSPYQPYSSYAGDHLYINLDRLAEYGLLKQSSIRNFNKFVDRVDYKGAREFKQYYFNRAYKAFKKNFGEFQEEYDAFCANTPWLEGYAVFMAFRHANDEQCWTKWPNEFKHYCRDFQVDLEPFGEVIFYEKFMQFMFYKQWNEIKEYANQKGIEIMGDIPFYVGLDSADVWEFQDQFQLDEEGNPTVVAGVPPDYFSETGQRWGNPIYNWNKMKKDKYTFWLDRLRWNKEHFDIIRIDHFRAFDTYWKINAECETAVDGEWVLGPAYDFFDEVYRQIPDINIVVEDLGDLRKQVLKLRDDYNLMGMNIIQFEMTPKQLKKDRKEHVIVYTGTHDNQTIEGYYRNLSANERIALRRFFHNRGYDDRSFVDLTIRYCLDSKAELVILPAQDILELKDDARMNTPSTVGSPNWEWKLKNLKKLLPRLEKLHQWIKESNRIE